MFCRHCGKQIPDDSKFCPGCGAETALENAEPVAARAPEAAPVPAFLAPYVLLVLFVAGPDAVFFVLY